MTAYDKIVKTLLDTLQQNDDEETRKATLSVVSLLKDTYPEIAKDDVNPLILVEAYGFLNFARVSEVANEHVIILLQKSIMERVQAILGLEVNV